MKIYKKNIRKGYFLCPVCGTIFIKDSEDMKIHIEEEKKDIEEVLKILNKNEFRRIVKE